MLWGGVVMLTWAVARETVLEDTYLGYTLASLDRLWSVFIFDTWSEDEWFGNRLWFINELNSAYDMWENEQVWTTRAEAEAFAAAMRERFGNVEGAAEGVVVPDVYVINLGDDRRLERERMDGVPYKGRHRGSDAAVAALREMGARAGEHYRALVAEGKVTG